MAQLELIHPGEILAEEFMKPLGLSANALALALRVPAMSYTSGVRKPFHFIEMGPS